MTAQLPLALGLRPRMRLEDFVAGANAGVLAACADLLDGRHAQLYLAGPRHSGRSHLLLGVCDAAERRGLSSGYLPMGSYRDLPPAAVEGMDDLDLLAVDDVDAIAADPAWEATLFALYNRCRERGTRLLFAADRGPASLAVRLPDLRSRLAWGLNFQLAPLDDAGRLELLTREAARRGLSLPAEVARYLLARCPRDPGRLIALVERLDAAALAAQRRLTVPFVRELVRGVPAQE